MRQALWFTHPRALSNTLATALEIKAAKTRRRKQTVVRVVTEEEKTDEILQHLIKKLMELLPKEKTYLHAVVRSAIVIKEIKNVPREYIIKN